MFRSVRRSRLAVLLLTVAMWGGASASSAPPAAAQAPTSFACTTGSLYALQQTTGGIALVNTANGASTSLGTVTGSNPNGLAIPEGGGRYAYAVENGGANAGRVIRYDLQTGTSQNFAGPTGVANTSFQMGGFNPANDTYYFANLSATTLTLYAFNTTTNTVIGQVATVNVGGSNGDLAFDSLGNLYFAADSSLRRVSGPIPSTAGSTVLASTQLTTLPSVANGIAFDGDGTLYLGNGATYRQVDPATGAVLRTFSSFNATDLATCATPNTIRVQKNLPIGRYYGTDQFTVSVTGGGITSGNTGTTVGVDNGVQGTAAETAGPALGRFGQSYTITETAAGGTNLANYTTTWACVNTAAGNAEIASGTGTTGSFTMPSVSGTDILCTFRNVPGPVEFECAPGTLYALSGAFSANNNLARIDTTTGASQILGTFGTSPVLNALGIPEGGGRYAYAVTGTLVHRIDGHTRTTQAFPSGAASGPPAGAVNPANGLYYYAAIGNAGTTLYAFDPATNTAIGTVATIQATGTNGDLAFDSLGNMYLVAGSSLYRVGQVPAAAGATALTPTLLTTFAGATPNGIAFDGDGTLYLGQNTNYRQVDPATGATLRTFTSFNSVDLASCATPNTIRAQKELPNGRFASSDQFTLEISGGGIAGGNVATTTGSDNGSQNTPEETAGPVLARRGVTYTVTETAAAGADLGNYTSTWRCVNTSRSDAVVASGTGATAQFTMPGGTGSSDILCTFRNEPKDASLTLDKQAGALTDLDGNGADPGDRITYTFVVENTGNVTFNTVAIDDPKVGAVTCPAGPLAPGAKVTCGPVNYTVTQADINNGSVVNTATATGTPPGNGPPVTTPPDTTTTPTPARAAIELDKRAGAVTDTDGNGVDAGDTITFTFIVSNRGNVPLSPVRVNDPKVGAVTCPTGTQAPGVSWFCTAAPYQLTQADIDRGAVNNSATATGTPPSGPDVSDTDDTTTPLSAGPALELLKQAGTLTDADANGIASAGDTIAYSFVVTNRGNVTLNPVTVSDPKVGPVSCPAGPLAPGAAVTCGPVTYTVTQADVTAGQVVNRATASGQPPVGPPVTDSDETVTPVPPAPAIDLDKHAGTLTDVDANSNVSAGDTIAYRFEVTNTGNVPLDPVAVSDPKVGPVGCPAGALAPGASVTCGPVTYTITQADVDLGSIVNAATATGKPPAGPDVSDPDQTTTPIAAAPSIALEKTAGAVVDANNNALEDAGDTITYSFRVTNTGNVSLTDIDVSDPKVGVVTCPAAPLAPGASVDCSPVTYTVTAADTTPPAPGVAPGVRNTATASGLPPTGPPVTDEDTVYTSVPSAPSVRLDKRAGRVLDANNSASLDAGDVIAYTFVVTNTGNQPLDPIVISDPKIGAVDCPAGALAIGATVTCGPEDYTLTEADILAGGVVNTATVTGTPPGNQPPVTSTDTTNTPTPAAPAISLDKRAGTLDDTDGNGIVSAGDTIDYSFLVTNTGNVTLDPVLVRDPKVGAVDCPAGPLAPRASITCDAAPYSVTQADVNRGSVDNTATAIGTPPNGPDVEDTDTTTTPTPGAPSLRLVKEAGAVADPDGNGIDAGDTIDYTFEVTNTGNLPLDPVAVSDPKAGAVTCPAGALAPGHSVTCGPVTYTVTQADVNAGEVENTATATGTPPNGPPVTDEDTVKTPTPSRPALRLVKRAGALADPDGNGPDAGDTIEYTFEVTNTGNVPLDPVGVTDPKVGAVTCPAGALAPAASVTCTPATYALTQADIDAGKVDNTATATGKPPTGPDATDEDTVSTPIAGGPAIALDKEAGPVVDTDGNGTDVGDTIAYAFTVRNTGSVTLTGITVDDPKIPGVTCPKTTLAPGETVVCGPVVYTLTAEDISAGRVVNSASAKGKPPTGPDVKSEDTVTTATAPPDRRRGRLSLDKRAGDLADTDDNGPDAGDTIEYTFVVTNVGSVKVEDITVSDPKLSRVRCPQKALAPKQSMTCTAPPYRITAAEAAAGRVENTATVNGQNVDGARAKGDSGRAVTRFQGKRAALRLDKTADRSKVRAGDRTRFTIRVRNTGDAAARNVRACDVLPVGMTVVGADKGRFSDGRYCFKPLKRLAAGASRSWIITVRIDRDVEDRVRMVNRAVVNAKGLDERSAAAPVVARPAPLPTQDGSVVTG